MADWWDIAGQVVGGGLSWLGSRDNAQNQIQASQNAANAITQNADAAIAASQPWAIGGPGGTADFDQDARTGIMGLSPELGNIYQGALSRSGLWGQQVAEYGADPFEAANRFYTQQEPFYQEQEDKMRTDLETRLLSQGRLGGTGGAHDQRALEQAIGSGQMQRRNQSFSQAQAMISSLLGRETGDIGTATGLLNIPIQYANIGRGIGGSVGSVAAAGLQSRAAAEKNLSGVFGSSGTGYGNAMQAAGGLFTKFSQPNKTAPNKTA